MRTAASGVVRDPRVFLWIMAAIAAVGFADALYLTVEHYRAVVPPCTVAHGCTAVLTSPYATVLGVPIALFGVLYYASVLGLAAWSLLRRPAIHLLRLATALGLLATVWFLYVQLVVLRSLCSYCLLSAATATALFVVAMLLERLARHSDTLRVFVEQGVWSHRARVALTVFGVGLLAAAIGVTTPGTRQLFTAIAQSGYAGSFVAGILYAFSFTASSATVILFNLSGSVHPLGAALLGALGAALYDFVIFTVSREGKRRGLFHGATVRLFQAPRRTVRWCWNLVGLLIFASPLPDELAAGMLGFSSLSSRAFLLISFLANAAGILVILLLR